MSTPNRTSRHLFSRIICVHLRSSAVPFLLLLSSCQDFGAGGTGEKLYAPARLRDVKRTNLSEFYLPAPTTAPVQLLPTTLPASRPAEQIDLPLEQARLDALQNNLDLAVSFYDPSIATESLRAERARFEAVFTTDLRYASTDSPSASQLNSNQSEFSTIAPGLRIPLQLGGSITLSEPFSRSSNDNQFTTLPTAYTNNPQATLDLPLLRGFGVDANAQSIRVAFYAQQQAQARTKLQVIAVIANVDRFYWRLYAAQKALDVRRAEFEYSAALLARNRRRQAAKVDPEVEVLRAESGLADRLEAVQTAQNQVTLRARDLKRVINRPDLPIDGLTYINLPTEPAAIYTKLDRNLLAQSALDNRMELLESELQILADTATIKAARNGILPLVNLTYTYGINGLGSGVESSIATDNFADHSAGLRLEIPIGNEAARSRLRQSLLARAQSLATKEQRTLQIRQLFDAVDTLELNRQTIVAAQGRVILNRRLLEAESRLLDAGLRTTTEVLEAQANLASARLSEIQSVSTYQIAQVDIAVATGTLLGAGNILWEPVPAPQVPRYIP